MQQSPPGAETGSGNSSTDGSAGGNESGGSNESAGSGDGGSNATDGDVSTTQGPQDSGGGGDGGLFGFDVAEYVDQTALALRDGLQAIAEWAFDAAITLIVGTGAPDRIVGPPTNEPWRTLYQYAHGEAAEIALVLFAVAVVSITAAGTFAGILSRYQTDQLWKRATLALVFNFFWWPVGAAALQVMDWLNVNVAPDGAAFTSSIEGAIAGVAGTAIGATAIHMISTPAILLLGMLYGARWVALAALLVFMRVLVMLWVVDASVFARVSNLASGFMSMFVPLLLMPLPTAMLMQVALLMFQSAASGNAGIIGGPVLLYMALGTLVASVIAPKYTFDYARSFMSQSFGAEKLGRELDAALSDFAAGLGSDDDSSTTAKLETPPALPPGDPTATPSTGATGGSGTPAAPATAPTPTPTTSTGSAYSTTAPSTATGATTSSSPAASSSSATSTAGSGVVDRASIRASMSDATPSQPTTWEALNEDVDNGGETVNKYLQDDYAVEEQRVESRRRELRRDSQFYGGDD